MIRVFLIAEIRLNREGLVSLINRDGRLEVMTQVAHGGDGQPPDGAVDVVVVDMSGMDGPEMVRSAVDGARAPVVALGASDDEAQAIALAEMGVIGFIEPDATLDDLVASVARAARNEASLPPRIGAAVLRRISSTVPSRDSTAVAALTIREGQVIHLVGEGLTNKEIAARLCIEVATVKNHVHNILEKLQVNRRSEAVARLRGVDSGAPSSPPARLAIVGSTP